MSLEKATLHECNKCNKKTVKVNWKADSDGASYTWITWYHNCKNPKCNFSEEKEVQHMYDFEDIENCGICGEKYIKSK